MNKHYFKVLYALKKQDYTALIQALYPLCLKNIKNFPPDMQADILQEYMIICVQLAKSLSQETIRKEKVMSGRYD